LTTFNLGGKLASKKWKYLREGYARQMKKKQLPSGSGATENEMAESTWPYLEYMTWLDGVKKERER
jgi:hypothetical protein